MAADDKAAVSSSAPAGTAPPSELKRLGKYQIEKKIGAGGMGAVFLARDLELKRVVALKVLPRDKAANPTLVRRFRAEAQAAAQLRHDNIVAVYDSGEADGYLFIAMEYVDGKDLFEMVARRGVVPVRRSIEIIKQVASALQHAFEQNIVHRDIKPSNLLIRRDGVVKLTDLGLARSVDDTLETNITRAGTTVGTVDYMSPEQARHSKLADIRSDLYSLGCTWFQMLTGSPPYPEGSVTNKLQAHAIKPIPDPRDINPKIPEGLTAVIRRMMAKKPEDRYQTPAELLEELNHATLTQAAISREIFSDLSDDQYADGPSPDEDEGSNDGYMEELDSETPTELHPGSTQSARRKPASTRSDNGPEAPEAHAPSYKYKPRAPRTDRDQEEPDTVASGSKPLKIDPREFERESDHPQQDAGYRRSRAKTSRPDSPESHSPEDPMGAAARTTKPRPDTEETESQAPPKPADVKPAKARTDAPDNHHQPTSKGSETKPGKAKAPAQKPLPPKMLPASDQGEATARRGISPDLLKTLGAGAGLIFVVGGLGWLISSYSNPVGLPGNPFVQPQEVQPNVPVVKAIVPGTSAVPGSESSPQPNSSAAMTGTVKIEGMSIPFDVEKLPDWASREFDQRGAAQLTVGPAPKSATHFNTLEEALQAAPQGGAVIKLQGDGPFPLPRVELSNRKFIMIASGGSQIHPVITFKPAEGQAGAGLKLIEGRLELHGVHFNIDRRLITDSFKAAEVVDGQLTVRQCSFTSTGSGSNPAAAMAVTSTQDAIAVPKLEPTLLVEQVFVRGDGLTAVDIQRANLDAVIRNSIIASGSASAIEVSGHLATGVAEVTTVKPRRIVRVIRSTLSAQNRIFDLAVDEGGKPPETVIAMRDSLLCSHGHVSATGSSIAFVGRWPQVQSATKGWLTRLTWVSTNTLYLGFEQLLDLGSTFRVADVTAWQRVWGTKADSRQFQKIMFPESTIDDLSIALPQEFDPESLSYRELKAADGGSPGCIPRQITVPDANSQSRVQAAATRPAMPAIALKSSDPVEVRKVDLKKEDLGAILNRGDWKSGTLFEASGGGLCMISPVKIERKSVKIVFKQTDGANLKLQMLQPKTAEATKSDSPALITVVNGTIELTNAVLEGYPSSKGLSTDWLIQATDSTVVLNGCRLLAPESDAVKQLGLIRWITSAPDQAPSEPPAFVCRDCYFAALGCGIRLEVGQGNLSLRNTVLAARGDAIDLRPVRSGNALLPVVDAENVTISATGAAVRFEAAPGQDAVASPVRLYFDRCAFAPPLSFKAGESAAATLLKCVGPVMEQRQVSWWGSSNGVARQIVYLIRGDNDSAGPSDEKTGLSAWKHAWDKANSQRFLTGEKGVYLSGELPNRWKELKPGSFEMHKASQAATWAEGGRPIGANTQGVETASIAKKAAAETASGKTPAQPTTPANSTKKNVGF